MAIAARSVRGALVAIWLSGLNNDVYFQIGLVTLIGLASKNAILIVEFAVLKRREGLSAMAAAAEAAKLRFRPIIMTLAFILGCVPLAISTGAGAASRHSIGTGVIGGMLAATFIAVFFISQPGNQGDTRKPLASMRRPLGDLVVRRLDENRRLESWAVLTPSVVP